MFVQSAVCGYRHVSTAKNIHGDSKVAYLYVLMILVKIFDNLEKSIDKNERRY